MGPGIHPQNALTSVGKDILCSDVNLGSYIHVKACLVYCIYIFIKREKKIGRKSGREEEKRKKERKKEKNIERKKERKKHFICALCGCCSQWLQ